MESGYKSAFLEKLKELKKVMSKLQAEEGDVDLSGDELEDSLEEAGEASLEGDLEVDESSLSEDEEEGEEEEDVDELTQMKRDYFNPKAAPPKRAGTATMVVATKRANPSMEKSIEKAMKPKGRKRKARA